MKAIPDFSHQQLSNRNVILKCDLQNAATN